MDFIIRGEKISLPTVVDAKELNINMAIFEASCSGNNPEALPFSQIKYFAASPFGNGDLRDTKEDAIQDGEDIYTQNSFAHNTQYQVDYTIEEKIIIHQ